MKVWNVTDRAGKRGHVKVVGQVSILPGQYVELPDKVVSGSKVQSEIKLGDLYAGRTPPVAYLASKDPVHVSLPDGTRRSHGESAVEVLSSAAEPVMTDGGLKVDETGERSWKRRHK